MARLNRAKEAPDMLVTPDEDVAAFRDHKLNTALELLEHPGLFDEGARLALAQFKKKVSVNFGKPELKTFEDDLLSLLASHMKGDEGKRAKKKTLRPLYRRALVRSLNDAEWETVERSLYHNDHFYHSRLTPAAQMKHGGNNIFEIDYKGKGVCSGSTECTEHATNLWVTEFSASEPGEALNREKETTLFRGIRHGILSPYGLRDGAARKAGAVARAKEVAAAALYAQKPEELKQAMASPYPGRVKLRLTSTSLVTAFNFGKDTEGKQLADQLHAWDTLREKPFTLKLRDEKGDLKEVEVDLDVAAFNFGVNIATLKLGLGWRDADKRNVQSLKMLFGPELKPGAAEGGWVAEYLSTNPPNAERVRELSRQIREIWKRGHHKRDLGEPYKMAQRIALLSHEIGIVPCYNCKSGKDRTAMLDSEIKREVAQLHGGEPLSTPSRPLTKGERELFHKVLENSGNQEIQRQNTGAPGNKVLNKPPSISPTLSFNGRIDQEVLKRTSGLSRHVRA